MKKRIISILVTVIMVASTLSMKPIKAYAAEPEVHVTNATPEGSIGTNHGYITVDTASGSAVTISVHPEEGYELQSLLCTPTGFVDLGITSGSDILYWAEKNLGASGASAPGDYYMWGATQLIYSAVDRTNATHPFTFKSENPYTGKNTTWGSSAGFVWANAPFTDGIYVNNSVENVFTKYTTSGDYAKNATPDNLTTLEAADDAATAANSLWRMPKSVEFEALEANCVWVWTDDYNGSKGYIVYKAKNDADRGKVSMNDGTWQIWDASQSKFVSFTPGAEPTGYSNTDTHIFLPAAGVSVTTQISISSSNPGGQYLSSTLNDENELANVLAFAGSTIQTGGSKRCYGYSVRPVMSVPKILPVQQTDGTYQFTMPSYDVTVKAIFEPSACLVTFDANGHGSAPASQEVLRNTMASEPVSPSASGYSFGGWYKESACTNAWNFGSDTVTQDITLYAKWTLINTPTPDPDPYYPPAYPDITNEHTEYYSVPIESERNSVHVNAKIENGIAEVSEITGDVLKNIISNKPLDEENDTTASVTIDLSESKQSVTGAELTKKSVEILADAVRNKNDNIDSVVIKMKEATVELDAKTLETLHESMAGNTLKLVVDGTETKTLTENQKKTIGTVNAIKTFDIYFESNGKMIHDFDGGNATVSINLSSDEVRDAENYKAFYIDKEGNLERHTTKYEQGLLTFITGHFSDFVIIYDNVKEVLLAEAATTKKDYIKLSWNRIDGAVKYVVYGAKCGKSYKELTETGSNSFTIKKINDAKPIAGKTYKFYVVAYDALGNKIKSKSIHYIAGNTSAKYANAETIKAITETLEMTVGEKVTLGAELTMYEDKKHTPDKHGKAIKYTSNCTEVAKVSKSGTVTAKCAGKAVIYIQDISGKWCTVEVNVKDK